MSLIFSSCRIEIVNFVAWSKCELFEKHHFVLTKAQKFEAVKGKQNIHTMCNQGNRNRFFKIWLQWFQPQMWLVAPTKKFVGGQQKFLSLSPFFLLQWEISDSKKHLLLELTEKLFVSPSKLLKMGGGDLFQPACRWSNKCTDYM